MPQPPNKIKYTSSFTNNTIKTKNYVLGINDTADYGPTSSTDFWNGITPTVSGYTVYFNKTFQGPSIFCPKTDGQLINLTQMISGNNTITTKNDAIAWYAGQTNVILVNKNYPNIVTSGLVLNYDTGFIPSYPQSGVTLYDLSFSGYNATLLNSPSFVLSGDGYINFQSANSNYATFNDLGTLSNFSAEVWVKQNSLAASNVFPAFICNTFPGGTVLNYAIGYLKSPWDGKIYGGYFNNSWQLPSQGFTPTTDQWYHYAVTYDGSNLIFYVDGNYYSSASTSVAAISSGSGGRIMRRWDAGDYIDGLLLNSKIYNRSLNANEIKQNFNAYSAPVGIVTTNLVLNYDAGNILSYPGTGTVWKNMSAPTTNNGILINGPTFTSDSNGGSITFDGTNDYVSGGTANMGLDLSDKTFQCWIKTNGQAHYGIIDKDFDTGPGVYGGWGFWINGSGKLWFWNHANLDLIDNGPLSVANATWTNVAVSYNSTTKSASFYYNGVLSSTQTNVNIVELSSGTQPLNIGCIRAGSAAFFKGNMSLLLAYNRALTVGEILSNYNATKYKYI